jgi:hypothetical protein
MAISALRAGASSSRALVTMRVGFRRQGANCRPADGRRAGRPGLSLREFPFPPPAMAHPFRFSFVHCLAMRCCWPPAPARRPNHRGSSVSAPNSLKRACRQPIAALSLEQVVALAKAGAGGRGHHRPHHGLGLALPAFGGSDTRPGAGGGADWRCWTTWSPPNAGGSLEDMAGELQ